MTSTITGAASLTHSARPIGSRASSLVRYSPTAWPWEREYRARRRALGWSQNELARRADVNHPTLFKIEADQRLNPSISVIVRIARALGTTAEALYGWERDDARLIVEANKTTMLVDVRPLGKKPTDAAQSRAKSFVTTALERAGAKVRDAGRTRRGRSGSTVAGSCRSAGCRRAGVGGGVARDPQAARRARKPASGSRRTRSKARIAIISGSLGSFVSNMMRQYNAQRANRWAQLALSLVDLRAPSIGITLQLTREVTYDDCIHDLNGASSRASVASGDSPGVTALEQCRQLPFDARVA